MRPDRIAQTALLLSLAWTSWLGMMLVHESGHALAAILTGGHVQRIIWHPIVFSRTDVLPNPSPLIVVWAGPIVGSIVPLLIFAAARVSRWRIANYLGFFAGVCLIVNGLYIGLGVIDPVGDAHDMLRLESPRWTLLAFGMIATTAGLWLWHTVGSSLGLGKQPTVITRRAAAISVGVAIATTFICLVIGNRGL